MFLHVDGQSQCAFCIAHPNASDVVIQQKLDYFCGTNPASCALIQPGQPCYVANDLKTTASYVYDYWFVGGAECNFDDTGLQTYQDLSKTILYLFKITFLQFFKI